VRGFFLAHPQACLEGQGKKKAQRAASARGLSERTISPDAQVRARCAATCAILVGCPQACLEGQGKKKVQRAASARGLSERTISPDAQVRARCAILVGRSPSLLRRV